MDGGKQHGIQGSHMKLEAITRTSPVFGGGQDEKITDYAVNMQLKYSYLK